MHRFGFRRTLSLPTALAIAAVLAAYVFFGSAGTWSFRRTNAFASHYASLASGFIHGRLSMAHQPDPRLAQLSDPYDPAVRKQAGVNFPWDASYFNGKYYLYFSPLPVLLFYIPFRIVAGGYPPDALAAVVFSTWAFVISVVLLKRALANRSLSVSFPIWVLLVGVGNVIPFTLTHVRLYEVSIAAGMASSATMMYALLRFLESGSVRYAAWVGVWLALAIATRPNLAVLLLIVAAAIAGLKERRAILSASLRVIVPIAVVAVAIGWYNFARFGSPFEGGISYQLTSVSLRNAPICSLCNVPEFLRWLNIAFHYLWWPPAVSSAFPFVVLRPSRLDAAVSFPGDEQIGGVAPIIPLMLLATLLAVVLLLRRDRTDVAARAGGWIVASAWLVMFGLATCWYVVTRYSLDFMMLMSAGSVLCIEAGLTFLANAGVRVLPFRIASALLACYSIALGLLLGLSGPLGAFGKANPELFAKLSGLFQ